MRNILTPILIIGLLLSLSLAGYFAYSGNQHKVAFIKNAELYDGFELKKELESKLTTVKNQRKSILDSLVIQLKISSSELDVAKAKNQKEVENFQFQKQKYFLKQKEFDEDTKRLAEQYSQQIWKQINQYVGDYGKEQGYSFIYGASGDGTLMFAQDKFDVTKELIEYTNEKYKGERK